jgi:hypothetical protein
VNKVGNWSALEELNCECATVVGWRVVCTVTRTAVTEHWVLKENFVPWGWLVT